jgi:hypothetical protein
MENCSLSSSSNTIPRLLRPAGQTATRAIKAAPFGDAQTDDVQTIVLVNVVTDVDVVVEVIKNLAFGP